MDYFKSTSIKQLEQMYKKEKDPKVKTKLLVVIHKKEKRKHKEITNSLRVSDATIKRIVKKFRKSGNRGLYRKLGSGKVCCLTNDQLNRLTKYIETNTPTSRETNQFIQNKFGKSYHPFYLPRLMRSLGFSRITPRKQHYKTDKTKQEEWKHVFKKRLNNKWVWVVQSSSKTNQ